MKNTGFTSFGPEALISNESIWQVFWLVPDFDSLPVLRQWQKWCPNH
jgi:hypothetical protein